MTKAKAQGMNGVAALYRARQLAELGQVPDDEVFAKRYPAVFSLLTSNKVTDDKCVDGANLRILNSNGDWLIQIGVPALGAFCEVMSPTFDEGMVKLDQQLSGGAADWRFSLKRSARIRKLKEPEK